MTNTGNLHPCPSCCCGGPDQTFLGMMDTVAVYRCRQCAWTYLEPEGAAHGAVVIYLSPKGDCWRESDGEPRRVTIDRSITGGQNPAVWLGQQTRGGFTNLYTESLNDGDDG